MAAKLQPKEVSAQSVSTASRTVHSVGTNHATYKILMSADIVFTTISLGIGVAASHKIGQLLGGNQAPLARRAALSPYILSIVLGLVEFVVIYSFRFQFGYLFTSDKDVVEATAQVLPLMAVFQILDLSNGGAGGILRGARKNHLSGMCNFVAYYGVGLSIAWALCFRVGLGLLGLWAGIISGSGALLVLQTILVLLMPWQKAATEASGDE